MMAWWHSDRGPLECPQWCEVTACISAVHSFLLPVLHQAVCLIPSPLPILPPCLPSFSSTVYGRAAPVPPLTSGLLWSLCFAQTTACLKILAMGGPPPDTLTPGRIVNSVAPYITRSCGGSGASLEASEEWGTCRSSSAETFSTRRQKFLTYQGQKVMFLLNVATLTHLGKTTELNWFEKLWRFRLKNIFYLKT